MGYFFITITRWIRDVSHVNLIYNDLYVRDSMQQYNLIYIILKERRHFVNQMKSIFQNANAYINFTILIILSHILISI